MWCPGIVVVFCLLTFLCGTPALALPEFSQRYKVGCATCHAPLPQLNSVGRAFKANFYHWPEKPRERTTVPLAYQQSAVWETTQSLAGTRQNQLGELFFAEGISLRGGRPGALFAQLYVQTDKTIPQRALGEAFVSLPLLGHHGELSLTLGQASALPQQYAPLTRLTQSQPGALESSAGGYSFTEPRPLARLEWFSNRGKNTANGSYVSLAMPFNSALTLTSESEFGTGFGLSVHAFRRWNQETWGLFGYENGADNRIGLLGTREISQTLSLLLASSTGHDLGQVTPRTTLEATWQAAPTLAVTGRWEQSPQAAYPVLALTLLPHSFPGLRLGLEASAPRGQRETKLTTRLVL